MVYIILPVHNRKDTTELFIKCLINQSYSSYHLVLIDDGSTDGTSDMVKKYLSREKLSVVHGKGNLYWGGALHKGYKWLKKRKKNIAEEDICLIVNDDTEFENDFILTGVDIIKKNKKSLLLAKAYGKQTKKYYNKAVHFDFKKFEVRKVRKKNEINCLATMGLFLNVNDFLSLGGFHPYLIPHYLSDYEFTIRAFQRGFKLMISKKLKLYFNESTTKNKPIKYDSIKKYIIAIFSKKSIYNYYSRIFLLLLRCKPKIYIINNLIKITKSYLKNIINIILKNYGIQI